MPEYLAPGVHLEELPPDFKPIAGVSTNTTGFVGIARTVPATAKIASFAEFASLVGTNPSVNLAIAVRGFFENGGQLCYLAGIDAKDPLEAGLEALANEKVSILCCPDEANFVNAAAVMSAHCESRKDRICILQSPQPVTPNANHSVPVQSSFAAYYYPWLTVAGLDGMTSVTVPPGGHIAGVYANTDITKGVWKAPAGEPILGVRSLSQAITDAESELLSSRNINVLRTFPGKGTLVWGARTTSGDAEWKYINVRRLVIFIEQSIDQGTQWVVFEPNGPALWAKISSAVECFLLNLWKAGALAGARPAEAYFVRCDQSTMTKQDIEMGRISVLVGVAPLQPAQFEIVRIMLQTQTTGN